MTTTLKLKLMYN